MKMLAIVTLEEGPLVVGVIEQPKPEGPVDARRMRAIILKAAGEGGLLARAGAADLFQETVTLAGIPVLYFETSANPETNYGTSRALNFLLIGKQLITVQLKTQATTSERIRKLVAPMIHAAQLEPHDGQWPLGSEQESFETGYRFGTYAMRYGLPALLAIWIIVKVVRRSPRDRKRH